LWITYIKQFNEKFDAHQWKDRDAARQLINEAKQMIATNPSREKLQQIVKQLSALLPETDRSLIEEIDRELLRTKT
jgi:ABC-type Zn2+ transport system substrate-binding protein/surface adhesin